MKLIPRGSTWQVHFTDTSGLRQRTSTGVRVNPALPDRGESLATLKALDIVRAGLMQDLPEDVRKASAKALTLGYVLQRTYDTHWSRKKSERSTRYRVQAIIADVGYWPLKSVNFTRLSDYAEERRTAGDTPATINRKLSNIQTALRFAMKRGELDRMPDFPHFAENNVKERYLSREEEAKLDADMRARTAPGDTFGLYLLDVVPFLLDTGLRASEVLLTREQDLGGRIWLPHGSTKSGRGRTVPLTKRATECLERMLASPAHWELVGRYTQDKDAPTRKLGRAFKLAVQRAGIKGVSLHTLRHTCASRLVQAGVSLYVVKDWLGHSSITVTERYAHLAPRNMDEAARALEPAPESSPPATKDTPKVQDATVH